jgi:arylsulfatase A-like enzyme
MKLPPIPPLVHCSVHGVRALGWVALFEFLFGVSLISAANLGGAGHWMLLGAAVHLAIGAALGLLLELSERPRHHPHLACFLIAAAVILMGLAVDRNLSVAPAAVVGSAFAWSRWRFPGKPSRKRAVFRVAFFGGLVALLAALGGKPLSPWRWAKAPAAGEHPVVVVVLDTVRRDHLSAYGYLRDTSPNLMALAQRGVLHPGWANACWSLPGHATLLTGRYSGIHGAHYEGGEIAEGLPTLQQVFGEAGYDTLAITGNPWLHVGNGTGDGFGAFVEGWSRTIVPASFLGLRALRPLWDRDQDKGGAYAARTLGRWLDSRPDPERPFFAVVNLMEAHAPYHQVVPEDRDRYLPRNYDDEAAVALSKAILAHHLAGTGAPRPADHSVLVDLYDGAVRGADRALGQVLETLEERGLAEDTVIIVTSDHGEHFGEHGLWGHVHGLYEEVLQIPFVVAGPGVPVGRSEKPARLIDVAPTALALAGVDRSSWPQYDGRPVGEGDARDPRVAEQYIPVLLGSAEGLAGDLGGVKARRRSWSDGEVKVHLREGGKPKLFDIAANPAEDWARVRMSDARVESAVAGLDAWAEQTGIQWPEHVGAGPAVSGWQQDALRALGYVE